MKYLPKGKWKKLEILSIEYNNIGMDGYVAMSEGNWKNNSRVYTGEYNNQKDCHEEFINMIEMLVFFGCTDNLRPSINEM